MTPYPPPVPMMPCEHCGTVHADEAAQYDAVVKGVQAVLTGAAAGVIVQALFGLAVQVAHHAGADSGSLLRMLQRTMDHVYRRPETGG